VLLRPPQGKDIFENLGQFVGVGFDQQKVDVIKHLTSCVNDGDGIFALDAVAKEKCAKDRFHGHCPKGEQVKEFDGKIDTYIKSPK
jgi:hypothetical protein